MLKVWCLHEGITEVIKKAWDDPITGTPIHILLKKLRNVKAAIKVWNKNSFGDIEERVLSTKKVLEDFQLSLLDNPTNDMFVKECQAKDNYHDALSSQEILFAQKSRIHWLKDTDRCTSFFYSKMKQHHQFNAITSVECENGQVTTDMEEIKKVFVDFFQCLFKEASVDNTFVIKPRHILSPEDELILDSPIINEEIKTIMMNFKPDKAPGQTVC
ncbi:uncharacterized protein LOC132269705 [Cornus florida]|uniref:uncharacterized protein LOC132269705 n=1 Tax=Cornus florida TaxID=4283 RepID=UPI00289AB261|nr:uncharacterized protein LOC132269705 [Cornus florida]